MCRRYYIVFTNDFSRVSWVYLLKDRAHMLTIVRKFFTEIKTQFSASAHFFQTDNAMKFV